MACKNPFIRHDGIPSPCGKCMPCLISRKSKWSDRILLESLQHEKSAFVTLTYNDASLPYRHPNTNELLDAPTLNHEHAQKFLKRIRKAFPSKLRYFVAGEYGSDYRPHYHFALFGYSPCFRGKTNTHNLRKGQSCCPPCDLLQRCWSDAKTKEIYGTIDNGNIEKASSGYIANYVTKKMFKEDGQLNEAELLHREAKHGLLGQRFPEYQRQSLRPGLGAYNIQSIADALHSEYGENMLNDYGDIPYFLQYKGNKIFLDRYIREQVRKKAELPEIYNIYTGEIYSEGQWKQKQAYQEEMLHLRKAFLLSEEGKKFEKCGMGFLRDSYFKKFLYEKNKIKILKIEKQHNLKG
jgi:hypothetical protein